MGPTAQIENRKQIEKSVQILEIKKINSSNLKMLGNMKACEKEIDSNFVHLYFKYID